MELPYTVIGIHPDDFETIGEDATYVEWVEAETPEVAADKAREMYEDRAGCLTIAVFEGHIVDKLFLKGLASDPRPVCEGCLEHYPEAGDGYAGLCPDCADKKAWYDEVDGPEAEYICMRCGGENDHGVTCRGCE